MGEGDTGAVRPGGVQSGCVPAKYHQQIPNNRSNDSMREKNTDLFWEIYRDAWTKKESAQENLFIRQKEIEKSAHQYFIDRLRALKEKLKQQRQHLDELDAHMYVSLAPAAAFG
ncbi:ATPase inhibitor [Emydomyces testavorans]|uniref:ATPase inhibitor, mitochondrial n=1 Tax=Emydomyces testavorans TaxID=2070801 RepID=A0AAF0DLG6_9EURO|nr:ATPase inhibitor [Emydomyces testavorans]